MSEEILKKKVKKDKKDMTFREKVIENVNVVLSAYAIAFVIRLLLIEAYQIPSQSMVPSLLVKDILMVEKVSFGTYIPIVHWKIPGFLSPKRNDVIVFISPEWKSPGAGQEFVSLLSLSLINLDNTFDTPKNLVKRLVGLPGDRISMSNRQLTINGAPVETTEIGTVNEVIYDRMVRITRFDFDLREEKFDGKTRVVQRSSGDIDLRQRSEVYRFPEIIVPRKGVPIVFTNCNDYYRGLVKLLVERESGKSVDVRNGRFFLDGREITEWKPADDYYFAMGDNRDFSQDCRYFGFIPRNNIFGRPLFRYFPFTRLSFGVNEKTSTVMERNFNQ